MQPPHSPRRRTDSPAARRRSLSPAGALAALAVPVAVVFAVAMPEFSAGVLATTLVVVARERLR